VIFSSFTEYSVKDWNPNGEYLNVGDKVTIPLTIKGYQRKGGGIGLEYTYFRKNSYDGEEF
jgi:hypothetical protein